MAELAPITAQNFRERVLEKEQQAKEAEEKTVQEPNKCDICHKKFSSVGAFDTHMSSKKHKEKVKSAAKEPREPQTKSESQTVEEQPQPVKEQPQPVTEQPKIVDTEAKVQVEPINRLKNTEVKSEEPTLNKLNPDGNDSDDENLDAMDEEEPEPEPDMILEVENCIFCTHKSESLEDNLKHMTQAHGFFIPDLEYIVDLTGMIKYLQDKVTRFHLCLTCNATGRRFHSTEAARGHMVSKGHCFVEYEEDGQAELEDFYDFKPSWEQYFKNNPEAKKLVDEGINDDAEEDWEDVDDAQDGGDDAMDDEQDKQDDDDDDESAETENKIVLMSESDRHMAMLRRNRGQVEVQGFDLVLPGGKSIGHRLLRRYYKQSFAVEDQRDSVVIQRLVSEYNAIGLPGFGSGAPTKELRRERSRLDRIQMRSNMRQGMNNNKGDYNKHIREQNTQ